MFDLSENMHYKREMVCTQLMKRACVNFTTSRVTSRLMGIRLLYRMMNVRRLYAKLVEMSPAKTHNILLFSDL